LLHHHHRERATPELDAPALARAIQAETQKKKRRTCKRQAACKAGKWVPVRSAARQMKKVN
jgi:hypothetical protein